MAVAQFGGYSPNICYYIALFRCKSGFWGQFLSVPRVLCLLVLALGFFECDIARARESESPLTKAIEVRNLALRDAGRSLPVRLTGVVVHCDAPDAIFIQDDTGGAFFRPLTDFQYSRGDLIEIKGVTQPGLYFTGIYLDEGHPNPVVKVGEAPLPEPSKARYKDLLSGKYHYELVEIEGIIRTSAVIETDDRTPDGSRRFSNLRLSLEGGIIELKIDSADISLAPPVDSLVRVVGLAAGKINSRRQMVQPYLATPGWKGVTVLKVGPSEEELPIVSESEIYTHGVNIDMDHRIRLVGTVLAATSENLVYLRGDSSAFAVQFARETQVGQGDRVEILGYPRMDAHTARIVDAALSKREPGPLPKAIPANMDEVNDGAWDSEYIEIQGEITDSYQAVSGPGLTLQVEGAALQVRGQLPDPLPPAGSIALVRGVCVVQATSGLHYSARAESVSLMLADPADLRVLELPSGWTVRRLALILAILLTVIALAALWISILRRQVKIKTKDVQKSVAAEAALLERQRIARDFHDTLEQELAGLHLRLDAASTRPMDPKGAALIKGSQSLVSRIQAETRNLISDLRNPHELEGDLVSTLKPLVSDGSSTGVSVGLTVESTPPRFTPRIVHHLRMIVFEAVTNAIKHADATEIEIVIRYDSTLGLEVEVRDDGEGFDVSTITKGRSGHFGCVGIQERCRSIEATVEWESAVGQGTVVRLYVTQTSTPKQKTKCHLPIPLARL